MSLLELRDLGVAIGAAPILTEVSLSLDRGEILGLVGESGAGKSMTALAILGLQPGGAQITGRILLDGDDLTQASDRAMQAVRGRRIGMVFQEPMTALDPLMSIGDQVAEPFRIHDQGSRTEARVAVRALLDRVGLDADRFPLGRYPHELSGGERQRVAIAMAIALQPDLIIADEPTSALDVINQRDILDLLKRLVREDGAALLLISHDLSVVVETADRVAVMKDGSLLEQAAVSSTFKDLTHPYSLALVKAAQPARRRPARSDADTPPVLSVQGVTRDYSGPARLLGPRSRLRAVDDVSFDLKPGESLGLVGESGCGKSTLLRAILALEPVQAGQVMIEGQDITRARGRRLSVLRRRIQMVFQDPSGSFDPRWKVHRLVGESFNLLESRPDPAEARRRVDAALEQVGLSSSDGDRFAHEFSGGQRQRIAIARALITEPAVLALDEAVSALDVQVRTRILDLLADLSERLSLAYLFVTHDLAVARAATDRVLVMQAGRIVEHGPTEAVFSRPVHAYTRRLLAATPNSALTDEPPETPS